MPVWKNSHTHTMEDLNMTFHFHFAKHLDVVNLKSDLWTDQQKCVQN